MPPRIDPGRHVQLHRPFDRKPADEGAETCTIVAVLISMAIDPVTRVSLLQSLIALRFILLAYPLIGMRKAQQQPGSAAAAVEE